MAGYLTDRQRSPDARWRREEVVSIDRNKATARRWIEQSWTDAADTAAEAESRKQATELG